MLVELNRKKYEVEENEFTPYIDETFFNLKLHKDLSECEILSGLISDLGEMDNMKTNLFINYGYRYGGFIPLNVRNIFNISCMNYNMEQRSTFMKNILYYDSNNTKNKKQFSFELNKNTNVSGDNRDQSRLTHETRITHTVENGLDHFRMATFTNGIIITYIDSEVDLNTVDFQFIFENNSFVIYNKKILDFKYSYYIPKINKFIHIPEIHFDKFYQYFRFYILNDMLNYNNLINLVIMVKNAGENFRNILKQNIDLFDRYTILDTGSTDNTIDIIREVYKDKKGTLVQEPFINFRESRNRSLELAGHQCKFNIILDDTYVIKNSSSGRNIRQFLDEMRSDQFSDSFSIYIQSHDVVYCSNRIIKSETDLRYKYKIHEVIDNDNNTNVMIPFEVGYIDDIIDDYMNKRTFERKRLDIRLLHEMLEEDNDNPRHYYYLAQTHKLLEEYDMTEKYFLARINHTNEGFLSEKIDACFELARLYNFQLNKPWEECMKYYMMAYELDKERPDSLYFIGIHYLMTNNNKLAYEYLEKAFNLGLPLQKQYSVKPTLTLRFLPRMLAPLCYEFKNYKLGFITSTYYLQHNNSIMIKEHDMKEYNEMVDWMKIYSKLHISPPLLKPPRMINKPLILFIADGGFDEWTGNDILTKGLGGSETHIVEMSKYVKKYIDAEVIVCCNCKEESMYEGVKYLPLNALYEIIRNFYVDVCFISRFSEYLPLVTDSYVESIYMFVHDLTLSTNIILDSPKLKKIFCLTEWHKNYFDNIYHIDKTYVLGNGVNIMPIKQKQHFKFIYSSFPNRGLLPLLEMWDDIIKINEKAELHVYCDMNNKWLLANHSDIVNKINKLLPKKNVTIHGWVAKEILNEAWATSHIWLYPCTFMETYCITAMEAAMSQTLVITNGMAGLSDTVGTRGVVIPGDATTLEWKEHVLTVLRNLEQINEDLFKSINYKHALNNTWENQAKKLIEMLEINPKQKETFMWVSRL